MSNSYLFIFFFFFQAEDGIRDTSVTGVQTCALPILETAPARPVHGARRGPGTGDVLSRHGRAGRRGLRAVRDFEFRAAWTPRSEERRVGKECRARGWRYE